MGRKVIKDLMADLPVVKGAVLPDVRNQIVAAVKFAKTIDKDKKSRVIATLQPSWLRRISV